VKPIKGEGGPLSTDSDVLGSPDAKEKIKRAIKNQITQSGTRNVSLRSVTPRGRSRKQSSSGKIPKALSIGANLLSSG